MLEEGKQEHYKQNQKNKPTTTTKQGRVVRHWKRFHKTFKNSWGKHLIKDRFHLWGTDILDGLVRPKKYSWKQCSMKHGGLPYARPGVLGPASVRQRAKQDRSTIAAQNSMTCRSHQVGVSSLQQHECQSGTIRSSGTRHWFKTAYWCLMWQMGVFGTCAYKLWQTITELLSHPTPPQKWMKTYVLGLSDLYNIAQIKQKKQKAKQPSHQSLPAPKS